MSEEQTPYVAGQGVSPEPLTDRQLETLRIGAPPETETLLNEIDKLNAEIKTTQGRCAGCKFWGVSRYQVLHKELRDEPSKRLCNRLEDSEKLWSESWDKEGIFTEPDFGCTEWSEILLQ